MGINPGRFILPLLDGIKIRKNDFEILLILVKEGTFYRLPYLIHFLKTNFFFLFIQSVLVQVLD